MARKFKLPTFRKIAAPETFFSGRDIFEKGGVTNLKRQGNEWSAAVQDSKKSYAVSVFMEEAEAEVTDWFCACPDEWNNPCKHVTALFFTMNDNLQATTTAVSQAVSEKITVNSTVFKKPEAVLENWHSLPKDEQKFLMILALAWESINQAQLTELYNSAKRDTWEANITPQFVKH